MMLFFNPWLVKAENERLLRYGKARLVKAEFFIWGFVMGFASALVVASLIVKYLL